MLWELLAAWMGLNTSKLTLKTRMQKRFIYFSPLKKFAPLFRFLYCELFTLPLTQNHSNNKCSSILFKMSTFAHLFYSCRFFQFLPPPLSLISFPLTFRLHLLSCSCHILTHTRSCVGKPRAQGLVDISSFITPKTKRSSHLVHFFKFTLKLSYQTEVVTVLWKVVRLMKISRSRESSYLLMKRRLKWHHHKLCLQLRGRAEIYWAISCMFPWIDAILLQWQCFGFFCCFFPAQSY